MKRKLHVVVGVLALGAVLMQAMPATAKEGPLYEHSLWTKMTRKLWRGAGNLTMGWIEIPVKINEEVQNLDPFTGFFTGTVKGFFRGGKRTICGAIEIVTFPVPLPKVRYNPLVQPESLLVSW